MAVEVRTWVRRHIPEALLIPAGVGAGVVTVLSDIDEVVPWGHELGIGVSQLAFAYVGAYIFNWLIVERPRARALRGYYLAAAPDLMRLQVTPRRMLGLVDELSVADLRHKTEPITVKGVEESLGSVDWFEADDDDYKGLREFELYARQHREAYETLVPLLSQFEPSVSVAIAHMNGARIHRYIAQMRELPPMLFDKSMRIFLAEALMDYWEKGAELSEALTQSKYTIF